MCSCVCYLPIIDPNMQLVCNIVPNMCACNVFVTHICAYAARTSDLCSICAAIIALYPDRRSVHELILAASAHEHARMLRE